MEIYEYDDEYFYQSISAKFIGIGAVGASASNYFSEVGNDLFPERLIVSNKDDLVGLQAKIARVDYLFVIMDIEDLELAAQVAKIIENNKTPKSLLGYQFPLTTFGILCPSAADARLADIPKNFGTWIILPEDKIAESGLTKNTVIYRAVNMTTSIIPIMKKRFNFIGMSFEIVVDKIGNFGKACIGFGESLDAENPALDAVKKALKSPLFIEDIAKAKKCLLVFVGSIDFLNMLQMNEAATFLNKLRKANGDDITFWQVDLDEPFDKDGVAAFVLATDFKK